jgi:3-hydroxy-5-methyl-1-naphthoate 3-O-methyltransferase
MAMSNSIGSQPAGMGTQILDPSAVMASKKWNLKRLQNESSYWRPAILLTAAQLDLFAWIGNGKKTVGDTAAHFGGDPVGWEIFLSALCAMGLIRKRGSSYANTGFAARYLRNGGRTLLLPDYDSWNAWGGLAAVLTSGKRPKKQQPFASDRAKSERLLRALDLHAREIAPYLLKRLPMNGARTLLDIGGGLGTFSRAFCRRYPRLRATLVEHPNIAALARRAVRKSGMEKRVRVVGLDFSRDALPREFDNVLVSNILHAHGVAENRALLAKLHGSLNPGGQLIVRDVFMSGDRIAPEWGTLFSVALLLYSPEGRCCTLNEVRGWLRQAGFTSIKGPFRSSPLPFDPDAILTAKRI